MNAQAQPRQKSGDTVTVICKIPMGMILHIHKAEDITEVTPAGNRKTVRHFPDEKAGTVTINGPAHAQNEAPRCKVVGGFALTEGVSKAFFDKWMQQTGIALPAVEKGLIQAFPDNAKASAAARENKKALVGLERLNPNALPDMGGGFKIKTDEGQVAAINLTEE